METVNFINELTWPAALTIVGTIVTIVLGLFGYARADKLSSQQQQLPEQNSVQNLHDRISSLKDTVSEVEGDLKAIEARLTGVRTSLSDHEARDVADFKALSQKVEKIMEIIVEMLKDER